MSEEFHRAYYYVTHCGAGTRYGQLLSYEGVLYLIPCDYVPPECWRPMGAIAPQAVLCC